MKRMTLANVKRGVVKHPTRLLLYGTAGVGKTTFASEAPAPIFVAANAETDELDVARWPSPPENVREIEEALVALAEEKHAYQTLVIDHLTWVERLVWNKVCHEGPEPAASVDEIPFGRGYKYATKEWVRLMDVLDRWQAKTGMGLILIAHARCEKIANPEGEDYERWGLDLHKDAASALYKWAPNVLFAHFDIRVRKDPATKRNKAAGEARFVYSQQSASHLAKTRFRFPPRFPLSWDEFAAAERAMLAPEPTVRAALEERIALLPPAVAQKATEALARPGQDVQKLGAWVEAKLVEAADRRAEDEARAAVEASKALAKGLDAVDPTGVFGPTEAELAALDEPANEPPPAPPTQPPAPRRSETPAEDKAARAMVAPIAAPVTLGPSPALTLDDVVARLGPGPFPAAAILAVRLDEPAPPEVSTAALSGLAARYGKARVETAWSVVGGQYVTVKGKKTRVPLNGGQLRHLILAFGPLEAGAPKPTASTNTCWICGEPRAMKREADGRPVHAQCVQAKGGVDTSRASTAPTLTNEELAALDGDPDDGGANPAVDAVREALDSLPAARDDGKGF